MPEGFTGSCELMLHRLALCWVVGAEPINCEVLPSDEVIISRAFMFIFISLDYDFSHSE
jgi:hypothetical protein